MGAPILNGRKFYQASGRVNWVRFIPWAALALAAAVVLSLILLLLFISGAYLVGIVPLAAGGAIAGMVFLALRRGHCRSRLVGGVFGALAGMLVYLGYYYACMVHQFGPEFVSRIDLLPQYIYLRIQTDQVRDVGAPDRPDERPDPGRKYFNALFFALECGLIIVLPCVTGTRRAGKPYCEKCQAWMSRETSTFKPELGPGFVEALRIGSVQSLAALFTSPPKPGAPNTAVALDYCASLKAGRTTDCPIFMSVKQITMAPAGVTVDAFDGAKGKVLVRRTLINLEETPALLSRFKSLESAVGMTAALALEKLRVEVPVAATRVMAEIRPVDLLFAGRVLTTKNALIASSFVLLGFVAVFGSIGLGFLGGFLAYPDNPPAGGVAPAVKVLGIMIMGGAILIFVANLVVLLTAPDFLSTRFLRRVILREFAARPGHLVNPEDPAAVLVQIIPRANWGKLKLVDASEVGFLRVDTQKGEVYLEGDRELHRIPGAAITSCEIESYIIGQGTHAATTVFRVVLQINDPSGFRELPLAQIGNSGKFRRQARLKWAHELCQQIRSVTTPGSSHAGAS